MRLYHYWDSETVQAVLASFCALQHKPEASIGDLAGDLAAAASPAKRRHIGRGDPRQWAEQTFKIARRTAYHLPPHAGCPVAVPSQPAPAYPSLVLPTAYQRKAVQTVREQLTTAGIRLASLLNQQLDNGPSTEQPTR